MSEWKEYKFSDFVDINPTVKLPKGENVPFVEMKDLDSNNRWCTSLQNRTLSGGSRFHNNDTLFARISPCFENGKICQVRNLSGGVGFGSTEFHVMRGLDGISDTDFVFYLCRWEEVKAHAYLHLEGSSGRQRVPKEAFDSLILSLPPIEEQRRIAGVLGALDEKIDLLSRENATLEALAETLFRHHFIENPDPTWKEGKLGEFINISSGKGLKRTDFIEGGVYPVLGANGEIGRTNEYLVGEDERVIYTGRVGTLGKVFRLEGERAWLSDNTLVIKPKKCYNYVYFILKQANLQDYDVGSTQPLIRQSDIVDIDIVIPQDDWIEKFEQDVVPLFEKIKSNQHQMQTLAAQRDTLLPRLMSGEVKVGEQ